MLELFSLEGKVALVTGASRGLGRPIARGLAAAGAHVVLVASDLEKLEAVRSEIGRDKATVSGAKGIVGKFVGARRFALRV